MTRANIQIFGADPEDRITVAACAFDGRPTLRIGDLSVFLTDARLEEISDKALAFLKAKSDAETRQIMASAQQQARAFERETVR